MHQKKIRGFTLIELMITVAIIGILVAVAFPSYNYAVKKNRRAGAQSALSDIAQRQQQFLMDNRAYTADLTTAGLRYTTPTDVSPYYTLSVTVGTGNPPSFTAAATPISTGSQASDGTLTLTSSGAKAPADKW